LQALFKKSFKALYSNHFSFSTAIVSNIPCSSLRSNHFSAKIVRKEGEIEEKDLRKKKAFAFFPIEIIVSFSPLFSFLPQESAALPSIFMPGLRLRRHGDFLEIKSFYFCFILFKIFVEMK